MRLRDRVQPKDQIVLAVNERMSYIYTLDTNTLAINKLVQELENDKRIDVIAWQEGASIKVKSGEKKENFIIEKAES
ncbi:hypothetical protein [Peribacillus simplex]|uniref:hypothetical protein n=1 Tax=Peribacillus simplex TaxID=1478 RepID=UPI003D2C8011